MGDHHHLQIGGLFLGYAQAQWQPKLDNQLGGNKGGSTGAHGPGWHQSLFCRGTPCLGFVPRNYRGSNCLKQFLSNRSRQAAKAATRFGTQPDRVVRRREAHKLK